MRKEKIDAILDYIIKHSKILFPIIIIAAVAVTVSVGLNAGRARAELDEEATAGTPEPSMVLATLEGDSKEDVQSSQVSPEPQEADDGQEPEPDASSEPLQMVSEEVPLVENENSGIYTLAATYYNAWASGDAETLASIYDDISEEDLLHYTELAKYLEYYPTLDIYTKPGFAEGSTIAYVYYKLCFLNHEEQVPGFEVLYICDDGQGNFYIKNEKNFTPEEDEYIRKVSDQDDAMEFRNRVNAEFADMMESNPKLWKYVQEVLKEVDVAIGETLAEQNAIASEENGEGQDDGNVGNEDGQEPETEQPAENIGPMYATATTTVNVRNSDSEQADKVGQIAGGTRIQVQEVRVNGWTKVIYEGNDGYIKSEYLKMEEQTDGLEVIGKVTANTNIRIRAAASLEAESLGILAGGESLEFYGNEDGWCKVNYNGTVAYVKAEYVTQE